MNGLELLRQIKHTHHLKHIPVIIYSTSSDKDHVQQAKLLGAANFVIKPSKFSDLCVLLQSMLNNFIL
jgi:CheY-like chemotaxis protein